MLLTGVALFWPVLSCATKEKQIKYTNTHNSLGLQSLNFIEGRWVLIMLQLRSILLTEF